MPQDSRRRVLGWGAGHQRPTAGLRVRMARGRGLQDRGVGTVIKVSAAPTRAAGAQPACRVKWDDGSVGDYFSGMTMSRNAVVRASHPDYDTSALEHWLDEVGWGQRGREVLASCSIRELLEPSGLKWEKIGRDRPSHGRERLGRARDYVRNSNEPPGHSSELSAALAKGRTQFTEEQWRAFGIPDLRFDDFVKAGDFYFRPDEMDSEVLHKLARLQSHKTTAVVPGVEGDQKAAPAAEAPDHSKADGASHARERVMRDGGKHVRWYPSSRVQSEAAEVDSPVKQFRPKESDAENTFTVRAYTPSAVTGALNAGCVHSSHWGPGQCQRTDGGDKVQIRLTAASSDTRGRPQQLAKDVAVTDNGDGTYTCRFSVDEDSAAVFAEEAPRVLTQADRAPARLEVRINGRHASGSPFPVSILGKGQRATTEVYAQVEAADQVEDVRPKVRALRALCSAMVDASPSKHRTRINCHTKGTGHDFAWHGRSGSSLPLEIA